MDDFGTQAIVGRIAVAVFVMIGPTLLFLGLLRGLDRLRDDAFIARWLYQQGYDPGDDAFAPVTASLEQESTDAEKGRCSACGASNAVHAAYCRYCLSRVA